MKKTILLFLLLVSFGSAVWGQSSTDKATAGVYSALLPDDGGKRYVISGIPPHMIEEMRTVLAKDTLIHRMGNVPGDTLIIDRNDRQLLSRALEEMSAFVWDDVSMKRYAIPYTRIVNRQAGDTLRNQWSTAVYELTPPVFIKENTIGFLYAVSSHAGSNWGGRLIAVRKSKGKWVYWWTLSMWDS